MEPNELYASGELSACARALEGSVRVADGVLCCRALARLSAFDDALAALATAQPADAPERGQLMAMAAQCHAAKGDSARARSVLGEIPAHSYGLAVDFEMAYAHSAIGYINSDADAMDCALAHSDAAASVNLRGRWLYARSWAAALRGDYHAQFRLLLDAIRHLDKVPSARDVSLLVVAVRAAVHLTREISVAGDFETVAQIAERIPWTADLDTERFLMLRGLAWSYALHGSYERAMRHAYEAHDLAASPMWVAACYADQAYLARMAGQTPTAEALLGHAVSRALATDWSSSGEERIVILNLIDLVADRDVVLAQQLWRAYDAIRVKFDAMLGLAHGTRFRAMEAFARGSLLAAGGRHEEAVAALTAAYQTFAGIGYAWRAAAAALRLHSVTQEDRWLRKAGDAVAGFTKSSVAADIRMRAANVADPRIAALTAAQRRICDMLCEGLSDKQIAARLSISPQTVKNHAVRVRSAFAVRSRAALVAAVRKAS